jgi:hypothetical protein
MRKKNYVETSVGGFRVRVTDDRVSVRGVNGGASFSVSRFSPKGALLEMMTSEESHKEGLKGILAVTWNYLSVVPDMEFLKAINEACVTCMERHRELYGSKVGLTDEEQNAELAGVMMDEAARQEFKKKAEESLGTV